MLKVEPSLRIRSPRVFGLQQNVPQKRKSVSSPLEFVR